MSCHYCDKTTDLRPYGPKGAMVCFGCAMATPERKREAERQFVAQVEACNGPAVIDGTEAGPYPAQHHTVVARVIAASQAAERERNHG